MAPIGVLPWLLGFATMAYGILSVTAGAAMLWLAWRCYRVRDGKAGDRAAMALFSFSILYLFLLFAEIIGERALMIAGVIPSLT